MAVGTVPVYILAVGEPQAAASAGLLRVANSISKTSRINFPAREDRAVGMADRLSGEAVNGSCKGDNLIGMAPCMMVCMAKIPYVDLVKVVQGTGESLMSLSRATDESEITVYQARLQLE